MPISELNINKKSDIKNLKCCGIKRGKSIDHKSLSDVVVPF